MSRHHHLSKSLPPQHPHSLFHHLPNHHNHEYRLLKLLGQGGFAKCYQVLRIHDQKHFAIKAINLKDRSQSTSLDKNKFIKHPRPPIETKAKSQANFLKSCHHPNIVKYEADFIYDGIFYIVMEHCPNGSFGDLLKGRRHITEVEARYFLRQMVDGLIYLKSKNIIHRDLKPANYLLGDNMEVKIADFGLATEFKNGEPVFFNICGTPNYLSPEMLSKKHYSYEVDVWSLGVALYAMLFGVAPFETKKKDTKETYDKIKKCDFTLNSSRISISSQAKDLISKILVIEPTKRISLESILDHPFMSIFRIPRELPKKCTKKEPDEVFLRQYSSKIHQKSQRYRNQGNFERPSFNNSRKISEPIRYNPPELESEGEQKITFTQPHYGHMEQKRQAQAIKQRNDGNHKYQLQKQSQTQRPKSMGETIKRFQKEQMLTSSPISSNSSIKYENQNKYMQYPSESGYKNPETLDNKHQSCTASNIQYETSQNSREISEIKCELPSYESFELQESEERSVPEIQMPSYAHLMKLLSFQKGPDFQRHCEQVLFDWKKIRQLMMRGRKEKEMPNGPNSQAGKIKIQNDSIPSMGYQKYSELNFYFLEDFIVNTFSIRGSSFKSFKMMYCLKSQNQPQNDCYSSNFLPTFIVGVIYQDNSSIVTKISSFEKQTLFSSVFIKNVLNFQLDSLKILNQTQANNLGNFDFFSVQLSPFKNQNHKNSDHPSISSTKLKHTNSQIKAKIKIAESSIKIFESILVKHFPNLFNTKRNSQKMFRNILHEQPFMNFSNLKFINYFRNSQQNLYFQLNDRSAHLIEKKPKRSHHFFKKTISNVEDSKYLIYFSFCKAGLIKEPGQKSFKPITSTNSAQILSPGSQPKSKVKITKEEENDEWQTINNLKKLKLNPEQQNSIYRGNSKFQQGYSTIHQTSATHQTSAMLQKICQQFQSKIGFYWHQEQKILQEKKKLLCLESNRVITQKMGCDFRGNRFYKYKIVNGMLHFKLHRNSRL